METKAIERAKVELLSQTGKHYVVLATTANVNNPDFYVGGLRVGSGFAAANFIFGS